MGKQKTKERGAGCSVLGAGSSVLGAGSSVPGQVIIACSWEV